MKNVFIALIALAFVFSGCKKESAPEIKSYKALISQSGTNDPVVTILGENTIGNIVWTRTSPGWYVGHLDGAFPVASKTAPSIDGNVVDAEFLISRFNESDVVIYVHYPGGTILDGLDGRLLNTPIEIVVYK